jgi:hypothetical protein
MMRRQGIVKRRGQDAVAIIEEEDRDEDGDAKGAYL